MSAFDYLTQSARAIPFKEKHVLSLAVRGSKYLFFPQKLTAIEITTSLLTK